METNYLKQIVQFAKESKESLNIRKEIIMDDDTTDEQLGTIIRMMYRSKVSEANETIKNITNKIKEYEK
jgi:hypothetical protein